MEEENHGSQLLPALPLSTGFNSGFGLKDTWLSSLPRLQVGNEAKGNFSYPLPSPSSFLKRLCFPIICPTDVGRPTGPLALSVSASCLSPILVHLDPQFST